MTEGQDIQLTRHAKRRMKWRNISLEEIKEALTYPNRIEHLPDGRRNAFKSIGEKLIRVSYIEQEEHIVVISVVDKNK